MPRKGTYTINHLLDIMARERGEKRTKSVPSSPAQIFDSCAGHDEYREIHIRISSALDFWKIHYPLLYHFAAIQLYSGARVSEILRLHSSSITADGRILIHALKNGNSRIVQPPIDQEWLQKERSLGRYLFADLSRFVIHRQYVKQGISAYFGDNVKRSTTHIFRHLVALDLKQIPESTNAIKTGLGQKTDTSADHYKAEIRRQSDN